MGADKPKIERLRSDTGLYNGTIPATTIVDMALPIGGRTSTSSYEGHIKWILTVKNDYGKHEG